MSKKIEKQIAELKEDLKPPGLLDDEKQFIENEIAELEEKLQESKSRPKKQKNKTDIAPVRGRGRPPKRGRGRPPKNEQKKRNRTPFEKKLEECRETLRKHRESKPRKEPVQHTRPKRLSDLMAKVFNLIAEANSDNPDILDKAQKDINSFYEKISREYLGTEIPISPSTKEKMEKKIENAA